MANHFDLTDLQLIVNIGDASSLTRGAEKSHLSLPAASNRVKNLEDHFGTRLFNRNSQGVTLTPSGEAFLRHARLVLRQIDHLRGDIHEYARGIKGQVRVLANTTAMTEFMPAVLSRYLASHPDVTVELRERLSYLVIKAVSEGSADIGIVAGRPESSELEYLPYRKDRLVLVTSDHHEFAERPEVAFGETMRYEYVGLSEWSAIHAFLIQAADKLGHPFRFRVEVGSFEAVCRMIEAGVGIGVVPELVARRYAQRLKIKIVRLSDEWADRKLQICVRKLDQLPGFARDLVNMLIQDVPLADLQERE
ncbi:LysR family transcriptional regulator [Alcaligenaceae bacterium LF4-65]|jgi:DNA-binding transcriptional LysR family regulator|uniref:LysR family transcriptional regulator n=1 Tax=Zwartia hollandica TaxID=324606 RepID=A0A953T0L5_9BURK|nr:LysR substrate-binding domain-containing protein [Zwartia hollandica]MBZ1349248.1 LysR family transcriptional regulator [Zwartia hollandica]